MPDTCIQYPQIADDRRLLLDRLLELRNQIIRQAPTRLADHADDFTDGRFTHSAVNLAHYLALRREDLRGLQDQLAALGLSSLGRGEAHILDNLNRVIEVLARIIDQEPPAAQAASGTVSAETGRTTLAHNARRIFGQEPIDRSVRIMVTLPGSIAYDGTLLEKLLKEGMDCARINCAHDDRSTWARMIANLRHAETVSGRRCQVVMDLAGQKIRTGPIATHRPPVHLKVGKDRLGNTIRPARILLVAGDRQAGAPARAALSDCPIALPLPTALHARLQRGDRFSFLDTRGKRRYLLLVSVTGAGDIVAECAKGAYLDGGSFLSWQRTGRDGRWRTRSRFALGLVPEAAQEIRLRIDERLLLTRDAAPGSPAQYDSQGHALLPARIGCSHGEIVALLEPGHRVWLDDGRIGMVVEACSDEGALLRVTHAATTGTRIQADKGLNFPDLDLELPSLTAKDLDDLDFVVAHADAVGFSFVQSASDIRRLQLELSKRGAAHFPIVAKIETRHAVTNLPGIILSGIGHNPLAIMIARGDLAVEIGNARLAEIQEEILWLCEAAHVPVVWATQVLETLAKKGIRSRPELTDAAMGVRAECVMLNKGAYIVDAVRVLASILKRMEAHQRKKHSRLRALHW
ncbi:MAG: pyruvate kinase [Gammaproteobacteria bacterium]